MRSENKGFLPSDEFAIQLSRISALDLAYKAHAYRARVIGEMLANAIVWLTRLLRRIAEFGFTAAARQQI